MRHAGKWHALDQIINWVAWPLTLYWVCLAWIFFRSPNLQHANSALNGFLFFRSNGPGHLAWWYLLLPLVLGCLHHLNSQQTFSNWWRKGHDVMFALGYGCAAAVVLLFIPTKYTPFIYFQF
jgi:alginate O-acetyltransferase complex protein AlgI